MKIPQELVRIRKCEKCGNDVRTLYFPPVEGQKEPPCLCLACLTSNPPSPQEQMNTLNNFKPTNDNQAAMMNKMLGGLKGYVKK